VTGDAAPIASHHAYRCPCGKIAYRSEKMAKEAHATFGWRIRTYRCPDAPGVAFHVTNHEKQR